MRFNRRQWLQWMPPGLAALLTAKSADGAGTETPSAGLAGADRDATIDLDVAIVGGGVSGCYVAYRLLQATEDDFQPDSPLLSIFQNQGHLKVGLFEYSGRVGGRLLAAELPQQSDPSKGIGDGGSAPRKYAEFGGFRFQDSMHIVRDLVNHLGLTSEPFPVDEPDENPIYLRNQRFRRGQLGSVNVPYRFTDFEARIYRGEILGNPDFSTYVYNQAFAGYLENSGPSVEYPDGYYTLRTEYQNAFRNEEWAQVTELRKHYESVKQKVIVDGRPLDNWPYWGLMTKYLSGEAVAYAEDSGGYNSLWSEGSTPSNLVDDFYFLGPPEGSKEHPCVDTAWLHVTSGYSDIPNRMFQAFLDKGGQAFLNHQLVRFDKVEGDDPEYMLQFFKRESGTLTSSQGEDQCVSGEGDPRACRFAKATNLVFAMPKRSIELLDGGEFFLQNPTVRQTLFDSVLNNPAIRIFMAYKEPWWKRAPDVPGAGKYNVPPTCGRSTTDLNVRQFYYWHTADEGNPNQESYVLASYANARAEQYWRPLEDGAPAQDSLPGSVHQEGRTDGAHGRGPRAATETMARLAHEQLKQVVGVDDAPEPYYAHFQNWTKDPWGAGWHSWKSGYDYNKVIPQAYQPLPQENIFICGECWSNVQGWVQGALNTGEVLLENKLGLKFPKWLTHNGTWLGPGSKDPTF